MPSGMRERRCGRIIAMPSMADPLEPAGKVAYVASGAGLHERMRTTSMPSNEINAIWILLDTLAAPPAPPFVRGRLRAHPGGSNQRTRRPPRRGADGVVLSRWTTPARSPPKNSASGGFQLNPP
jgi:hypothetical protein